MLFNYFKRKNKSWKSIYKESGNPGIAWYVKKENYDEALKFLDDTGKFHDLAKTSGVLREFLYKDFEYKSEITNCDFSKELLKENDIITLIWVVDKALKNKPLNE